jgi:NitT/TauT family transport system substrate-binding protein
MTTNTVHRLLGMSWLIGAGVTLGSLTGGLAPSQTSASAAPAVANMNVKVSDPTNVAGAPIYIALDQGFFSEEGLDVELVPLTQTEVIQSVATGQIQFGMSLPNPSLFNALERGIAVKIVASAIVNQETDRPAVFMVRSDLIDGGKYTSPRDLKGASIAANADASQFYVERVLGQGGLTRADVVFVNIPQLPDVVAALAARAIDAAWLPEPFATSAERQGLAKTVATTGQLFPGASTQTLIMAPTLAETQPEIAQRFVLAYLRGLRVYYHAMNKGDTDRAPVVQALVNHTPIKDPDLYSVMGLPGMDPNATLDLTSWSVFQDYFVERGFQQQRVDLTPYIDTSMLDDALERLGREP